MRNKAANKLRQRPRVNASIERVLIEHQRDGIDAQGIWYALRELKIHVPITYIVEHLGRLTAQGWTFAVDRGKLKVMTKGRK